MNIPLELEKTLRIACKSDSTVLIQGETGTGKTSIARIIHEKSPRAGRPFSAINLATLHEGTIEAELFGHEKGAFTGAEQKRVGRLEAAQGGTVFLDEIGDLSPRLQARLLEFLQSKTITPLGSNREVHLDVRVIAATHRDLEKSVTEKLFREDLFHRMRIVGVHLSPLRNRVDEMDSLIHACLSQVCEGAGRSILRISSEVAEKFEQYSWPGNVRELKNVLEYAVWAAETQEIILEDLPLWLQNLDCNPALREELASPELGVAEVSLTLNFQDTLARFEREYLSRALSRNRGRIHQTAIQIGLNKTTLLRRMRAYKLLPERILKNNKKN